MYYPNDAKEILIPFIKCDEKNFPHKRLEEADGNSASGGSNGENEKTLNLLKVFRCSCR